MSDLEPSVPASSSPSLPATDSNTLNYAFLVHSQKTLTQNLPPRVDNKLLARQKRRRTRYVLLYCLWVYQPVTRRAHDFARIGIARRTMQF